jgi:DNA-binding Lrp family transcriptional regulator
MERLETILRDLGLDDAMTVVFEYLADKRRATFEQIYDETRLSRQAISLAVETLEAKGALKRDGPHYVIESIHKSLIAMAPARFEEITAEINSYRHPQKPAESCPVMEMVRADIADIPSIMGREIASAINHVDMISRTLAWLNEEILDIVEASIQRGVRVRILTYEHPDLASDARALRDAGAEVRAGEYAGHTQLAVVDGISMILDLPVPPRTDKYLGVRVRDRETCKRMLEDVFEPAWDDAESL